MFYENGWGVAQDYGEAMRWFRKVADQGDAFAQNKIGVLYYNGWGVVRDYGDALVPHGRGPRRRPRPEQYWLVVR